MLITTTGFVALSTGPIEAIVEVRELGTDEPTATVVSTHELAWSDVLRNARIELTDTVTPEEHGPGTSISYLTITVPLQDDESRRSAYRLREYVETGSPHPANDEERNASP